MKKPSTVRVTSRLALFVATIFWGSSFVVIKNALDVVGPLYASAARFTFGALFIFLFGPKHILHMRKKDILAGLIPGVALWLGTIGQAEGLYYTTPGKNAFLTAIYSVLVPFVYWIVSKKRPDRYNLIAALLCIAGVGLVSLQHDMTVQLGDWLTLFGGLMFAIQLVFVDRYVRTTDTFVLVFMQFASVAVLSWIAAPFFEPFPVGIGWDALPAFLYLGLFVLAVAFLLQMYGQQHTHASESALILSLESVFGVITSLIFYGEELTLKLAAGFFLIFVSVVISETKLSFLRRRGAEAPAGPPEDALHPPGPGHP